jgi:hypothetical protein
LSLGRLLCRSTFFRIVDRPNVLLLQFADPLVPCRLACAWLWPLLVRVSEAKLSSYGGAYVDDVRGRKVVPVGRGPGDLIGKVHGYMTQAQEPALWCTKQTINPRLAGI